MWVLHTSKDVVMGICRHHCLGHVGLHVQDRPCFQKNIDQDRVLGGALVIQERGKSERTRHTLDIEGFLQTDWDNVKWFHRSSGSLELCVQLFRSDESLREHGLCQA